MNGDQAPSQSVAKVRDWTFYKEIREQIKHEDGLTNQRMTWLMQLQSFLFGAYGFTVSSDESKAIVKTVHIALPVAGLASALLVFLAIRGTLISVRQLVIQWNSSEDAKDRAFHRS